MKGPIVLRRRRPVYYTLIDMRTGAKCIVPAGTAWAEAYRIMGTVCVRAEVSK